MRTFINIWKNVKRLNTPDFTNRTLLTLNTFFLIYVCRLIIFTYKKCSIIYVSMLYLFKFVQNFYSTWHLSYLLCVIGNSTVSWSVFNSNLISFVVSCTISLYCALSVFLSFSSSLLMNPFCTKCFRMQMGNQICTW